MTDNAKALDEGRLQPVDKGVVVTQEARKAAADLLDEVSSLLGDTGIGQVAVLIRDGKYDEHDATLAFARFERDILARSRSEVGCTVPAEHPLAKGLRTSQKALDEIKRQEQANIAGYLAMRDMPIGSVAADARHQSETGAALPSDGREADVHARCTKALLRHRGVDVPKDRDWASVQFGEIAAEDVRVILAALAQPVETGAALLSVNEKSVMVCPQCEGEGGYPDGLDEAACHTDCTRCAGNGWIVDLAALAQPVEAGEDET